MAEINVLLVDIKGRSNPMSHEIQEETGVSLTAFKLHGAVTFVALG